MTESFESKLKNIDIGSLGLKQYPLYYFNNLQAHLPYYIKIYKQIIDVAVAAAKKPVSELTLLDYGAGNGLLGLFAKIYGFKKVWINDLSPDFLEAAKKTSQAAEINIDGFISGDIQKVIHYFNDEKPDILLSTDAIEHIYDLEDLFSSLRKFNPSLIHVFTTASNPLNIFKVNALHKLQYKDEYVGYRSGESPETNAAILSFYEQRKNIIKADFPHLDNKTVAELSKSTRGKKKDDILLMTCQFLKNGKIPKAYKDPYIVCDPETGSMTERILPLKAYKQIYIKNGFNFSVTNGFYNEENNKNIPFLRKLLNLIIQNNKSIGKFFAPYIIFLGSPNWLKKNK